MLPNVRENLEALSARDDVVNMLLTGNVAAGAEAKLRHYGLWEFFGAGGAFSVEGSDRPSIARRARELAAEHSGERCLARPRAHGGDRRHAARPSSTNRGGARGALDLSVLVLLIGL